MSPQTERGKAADGLPQPAGPRRKQSLARSRPTTTVRGRARETGEPGPANSDRASDLLCKIKVALMREQLRGRDMLQRDRIVRGVCHHGVAECIIMCCCQRSGER